MSKKPHFIQLALDRFQMCSAVGCASDACVEYEGRTTMAAQLFFAACSTHDKSMAEVAEQVENGESVKTLAKRKEVNLDEVFISPRDYTQKCRFRQWEEFVKPERKKEGKKGGLYSIPPPANAPSHDEKHTVIAPKRWRWLLNRDRWRSTEGVMVPLERIRLAELISAARQIAEVNFDNKIPRGFSWTKNLPPTEYLYVYPEEELRVNTENAKEKLTDMCEELTRRGILS